MKTYPPSPPPPLRLKIVKEESEWKQRVRTRIDSLGVVLSTLDLFTFTMLEHQILQIITTHNSPAAATWCGRKGLDSLGGLADYTDIKGSHGIRDGVSGSSCYSGKLLCGKLIISNKKTSQGSNELLLLDGW
jgi:hypothetical protein